MEKQKTRLQLYVKTDDTQDTKLAIQLWNTANCPEIFFGGVSEVQHVDGKNRHSIITQSVMDNGVERKESVEPYVAFIRRLPANDEEKNSKGRVYTGRIRSIAIRRDRGKVDLGLVLFVKSSDGREFLTGFYNANGLTYNDRGRVVVEAEGTCRMTADVGGALRETLFSDIRMNTPKEKKKAAARLREHN